MLGCILLPLKPMREQKNDLVASAALYIDTLNQYLGRQVIGLSDEATKLLLNYEYPCNRTQFKRILKKAVLETNTAYISGETIERILQEESVLFPTTHPLQVITHDVVPQPETTASNFSLNLDQPLDQINRDIVMHILELCNGNQTAAGKKLGISGTTLWRYIKH